MILNSDHNFSNIDNGTKPAKIKESKINKEKLIIYGIIGGLIILIVSLFVIFRILDNKNISQKEKLSDYLENYAKVFYEDYYYLELENLVANDIIEDVPLFLSNFVEKGIEVTLNKMIEKKVFTTEEIEEKMKNDSKECDLEKTKVIFYPKSPYEKASYTMKLNLECGNLDEK